MGLLNSVATNALSAVGLSLDAKLTQPPRADFEAFIVQEVVNGSLKDANENGFGFYFSGSFMPQTPFEFGGTQKISKDYYPGSEEATVQVHGPQENDLVIKGRFRNKHLNKPNTPKEFKIANPKAVCEAYQKRVDEVRTRGNLLKLQMGEWVRWAILEEGKFTMNRLTDIEYEIKFSIVGKKQPTGCHTTEQKADDPRASNNDLVAAAAAAMSNVHNYPSTMPRTLAEFLNAKISDVAGVVSLVTGFVDGIIDDANAIVGSANRAIGMIKYARAYCSKSIRTIGSIANTATNLGSAFHTEAEKTSALIRNAKFLNDTKTEIFSMSIFLAALQRKFELLSQSLPRARHLVVSNDTLQSISLKYYGTSDNWKKVYDHNSLTSTVLTRGTVLEIPK